MVNLPESHVGRSRILSLYRAGNREGRYQGKEIYGRLGLLAAGLLLASLAFGQGSPRVTGVDPASGKVNDNVTVTGENLGKASVSAVLLSDDKTDYKATVVEQAGEKIVMKIPQVKPGDYNVSIQVGNNIFIQPLRFKVQE